MAIGKTLFFIIAIFVSLFGLVTIITVQFRLLKQIKKWNPIKAYIGIFPFFFFLFLKFDKQVKIVCRNYPMYISSLKSGLVLTLAGVVSLFLTAYL